MDGNERDRVIQFQPCGNTDKHGAKLFSQSDSDSSSSTHFAEVEVHANKLGRGLLHMFYGVSAVTAGSAQCILSCGPTI